MPQQTAHSIPIRTTETMSSRNVRKMWNLFRFLRLFLVVAKARCLLYTGRRQAADASRRVKLSNCGGCRKGAACGSCSSLFRCYLFSISKHKNRLCQLYHSLPQNATFAITTHKKFTKTPFPPAFPAGWPLCAAGSGPARPRAASPARYAPCPARPVFSALAGPLPAFAMYSDASYKTSSSIRSSGNHFPRNSGIYCIPSSEGRSLW